MAKYLNLLPDIEPTVLAAATAAGTSDINGNVVDMAGFESVIGIVCLGAVTDTGTLILKAQTGDASDGSDMADISGATTTIVTESGGNLDNKYIVLDVHKPLKRYARFIIDRGTANAVVEHAVQIRYNAGRTPCAHGTIAAKAVYTQN